MARFRYLKALLTGAAAAWIAAAPVQARDETVLRFCYDPYPPYTMGAGGIPSGGLKVQLLKEVTSRIEGLSAVVVLLPWQRCQAQAQSGEADGILPLFRSSSRESYLAFTEGTFLQTNTLWFSRRRYPGGLELGEGFAEVSQLRLGMVNASVIDEEMEAAFERHNPIVRSSNAGSLMQMLLFGQLDLVALDDAVGWHQVTRNGWQDRIGRIAEPISSRYSHFGLSKAAGADAYLDAFNRAISELRADGRIAEILGGFDFTQ